MLPSNSNRITEYLRMIVQILRTMTVMSDMMRCSSGDECQEPGNRAEHRWNPSLRRLGLSLLLILAAVSVRGGEPDGFVRVSQPGETLRYKVKWHFVRLGTITIRTFRDSTCGSPTEYRVAMIVESNPDLSFVAIREYNESFMKAGVAGSQGFRGKHFDGDACTVIRRDYDENGRTVVSCVRDGRTGGVVRLDTLRGVSTYLEGPSLFQFARCASRAGGSRSMPTLVGGDMSSTDFEFGGEADDVEIGACETPVHTRTFTGFAHWTGGTSVGLTGEFTGWLSDDEASVPIRAEMRTLLGPITLELEQWTRDGWSPRPALQASSK